MIAALYVQEKSIYHTIPSCDPWPASRDARLYSGRGPIVAHPPCGPWGRLSHMCYKQDKTLAPIAVGQVRKWGGILEHPCHSKLWQAGLGMSLPGGLPDAYGGITVELNQLDWGHVAVKPTWIYVVGATSWPEFPPRIPGDPLALCSRGRKLAGMDSKKRSATPIDFAKWLLALALLCEAPQ
jgi:hypothetical protein